jgi:pyruvate, water dikinase
MRIPVWLVVGFTVFGCKNPADTDETPPVEDPWECSLEEASDADFAEQLGCWGDFEQLASAPLDASIPGASSAKTVVDRSDGNQLYFQNSERYPIHWEFVREHLSGNGLPIVQELSTFNNVEYYSPDRRFILGAVTWYDGPQVWTYEISPYDTADVTMITEAYRQIRDNAWFGDELTFHPTSKAVEAVAVDLPADVLQITTDELFAGIDYQPLNVAESYGKLTFYTGKELEDGFPNFREIVVLEEVPNDISVVAGIVTEAFQTPLSHINVLSRNRGTPNMGLREAFSNEDFRALEGKWVRLSVQPFEYVLEEATQAEADAWWEANKPEPLFPEPMDLSQVDFVDDVDMLDTTDQTLSEAIYARVPAFGGKATHFGALALLDDVPNPSGFGIPVYYYNQHMEQNDLWAVVDDMLADPDFLGDAPERDAQLEALRDAIIAAPIDADFLAMVEDHIVDGDFGTRMRFRSSTNAEDVEGFNGAGLYTSKTGDLTDPDKPIDLAIKKVWASVWTYRAFDERQYYSIEHRDIGMAMLCHRSFPDEDANGVAITANIFDATLLEPAFYVNVQLGEESVVLPEGGTTTDQFLYYYDQQGQPIVYLQNSSLVGDDETVLTTQQVYELGTALKSIHNYFYAAYGGSGFYGMDVEFKFDSSETGSSQLYVKQARPYPGL